MPDAVKDLLSRPKHSVQIEADYESLKEILLEKN